MQGTSIDQQPLVLRPSPWSSGFLLLFCVPAFCIGVIMLPSMPLAGLGAVGFGIFGIREGVLRLRPGHTWMEVDPQRLSICRNFRVSTYSWEAVETFEIESVNIGDDTEIDVLQMIMANDEETITIPGCFGKSTDEMAQLLGSQLEQSRARVARLERFERSLERC